MIQEQKYQGLIAACGMNCGLCIGYLRDKNSCGGCFKIDDKYKPKGMLRNNLTVLYFCLIFERWKMTKN